MITIQEKYYIGEGKFQRCYVHPNNDNLCLKTKIDEQHQDPRVDREIKYYKKIQRKKKSIPFIAKYHGEENTNYGNASVFDLVRDETTNKVSLSIHDYLEMENSPFSHELFVSELIKLKKKLIKNKIIVRDLTGKNICCKILKDNSVELIVIDGVGHRDFIPLVEWIPFFTKRKINKIYTSRKLHSMPEHIDFLAKQH